MACHLLSIEECYEAVTQMVISPNFRFNNQHLLDAEVRALLQTPPVFPLDKSVYSPYAGTHDGYSQVYYKKKKYLMHRITYIAHTGRVDQGLDCSHTLYLGKRTSRNVNPNHLSHETNEINRGRNFCHAFFEKLLVGWVQGEEWIDDSWTVEDIRKWVTSINYPCRILHKRLRCNVNIEHWLAGYEY